MPWAPWSWSTADPVLTSAVSASLRATGVRMELCEVSVSYPEDIETAEEKWAAMKKQLAAHIPFVLDGFVEEVDKSCNACGSTPSLSLSFQGCARCKQAYYCSRGCQKED